MSKNRDTDSMFQEGPQREIYEWRKALGANNQSTSLTLDDVEDLIKSKARGTDPVGWRDQPLYKCEMIQRMMRVALMHWNLSSDKHKIRCTMEDAPITIAKEKFPERADVRVYRATLGDRHILFIGTVDQDFWVNCIALYVEDGPSLCSVRDIHELLNVLCIPENEDSIEIITKEISSYYEFQEFVTHGLLRNVNRWLHEHHLDKPTSCSALIDAAFSALPENDAAYKINTFLEAVTTPRPFDPHGFLNDLEEPYRSRSLRPVPLYELRLPLSDVTHLAVDQEHEYLRDGSDALFYIHPTTVEILRNVKPDLVNKLKEGALFYPTLGSRSGYIKLQDGNWQNFQVKIDLFRVLGGWYRLCGLNGGKEETEVAALILKHERQGHVPPPTLKVLPTTEAAVYTIKDNLHFATLARPIPDELRRIVLIPATFLYTPDPFTQRTFLEELLAGKSHEEIESFVEDILLYPAMKTWDYFLSLEDSDVHEWGYAFEMHGLNHYYVYDRDHKTLQNCIVAKDFASNRILKDTAAEKEKSQEWIIDQYDVSFGQLHLKPMAEDLARITSNPVSLYEEMIQKSFIRNISAKNKEKFIVDGRVLGTHRDVYEQLEYFYSPRERTWNEKPRFRPHLINDYLI